MKETVTDIKDLDKELLGKLDEHIATLDLTRKEESLIPTLYKAQELFGYLPHNLQWHIARQLDLPSAHVNGVVTFYSFFSEEPMGKYTISVCMGTACFVKGADKVLDKILKLTGTQPNEMSEDGLFTVKDVRCIGACGLAPVLTINEKVYGNVTPDDMDEIIESYRKGAADDKDS